MNNCGYCHEPLTPVEECIVPGRPGEVFHQACGSVATARAAARTNKYRRPCPYETVDVYRVLELFQVTAPALQHAAKKILCAGQRGAKDKAQDVREAIVALERWEEMRREESEQK